MSKEETEMTEQQIDFIWECLATMAEMKFYIQRTNQPIAEEPAFLIYNHKLYMNNVAEVYQFRFKAQAERKLREIIGKANYPMKLWTTRNPRKNQKHFAENTIERFPKQAEGTHLNLVNTNLFKESGD